MYISLYAGARDNQIKYSDETVGTERQRIQAGQSGHGPFTDSQFTVKHEWTKDK